MTLFHFLIIDSQNRIFEVLTQCFCIEHRFDILSAAENNVEGGAVAAAYPGS